MRVGQAALPVMGSSLPPKAKYHHEQARCPHRDRRRGALHARKAQRCSSVPKVLMFETCASRWVVFETEEHLRAKSVLALSLIDDAQGED